jgi:hypothetical protein
MALDPRISLAVQPPNIQPPDLLKTMLASAQLREASTLNASRLQQMQEMQAELVRQERQREIVRQHLESLRGGWGGQPAVSAPSILQQELRPTSSANVPVVTQTEFRPTVTSPITSEPGFAGTVRTGEDAVGVRTAEPVRLPEQPLTQTAQPVTAPSVSQPTAPGQQVAVPVTPVTNTQPATATTPPPSAQVTPLPGMHIQPRTTTQLTYALLGNGASNAIQTAQAVESAENAAVNRETAQLAQADAGLKYLRNLSQVVNSQESLDRVHAELDRRAPGISQLLPQTYTAETWKAWQDRLTPLAERIEARKAQIEAAKFGLEVQKGGREERKTALEEARLPLEQAKSAREEEELKLKQRTEPAKATQEITKQELALQKEYNDLTKPYRDVRDAMGRIEASAKNPTPAGDMSVVYAYMKLLDPQTGIRNEEVRNAETVGGLPAQANYWMQWIQGGARLPENIRNDFVSRAKMLYGQYTKDYEDVAEQYREQARRQKLDPANVVPEYRSRTVRETQAKKGTAANPVTKADIAEMINREGGTEEEWRDILRRSNKVVE